MNCLSAWNWDWVKARLVSVLAMASRPPVLFRNDFLEFGDTLTVTYEDDGKTRVSKQKIDYEPLEAGNLHTNCSCTYQLIVE